MEKKRRATEVNDSNDVNSIENYEKKFEPEYKKPFTVRKTHTGISLRLGELWEYHELIYFLVWRDLKVRYRQTIIGALWAIIQPLLTMVIFSIFFVEYPSFSNLSYDILPG